MAEEFVRLRIGIHRILSDMRKLMVEVMAEAEVLRDGGNATDLFTLGIPPTTK